MAHKLPTTESFADMAGSGQRWTIPTLYWPCKAWIGGTDPTGLGHSFVGAKLNDAYKAATGLVTPTQEPKDTDGNVGRAVGAYVFRPDQREDVELRLEHLFQNVKGDGGDDFLKEGNTYAALGARIHGAAGTDFETASGYTEALRSPNGYWFIWGTRGAGGDSFLFFKFIKVTGPASGGGNSTITELDSLTFYGGGAHIGINAGDVQKMRFTATTNGGVAELRGFYLDPNSGTEQEVLSYDDASSPFNVTGHSGFWLSTEIVRTTNDGNTSPYGMIHGTNAFEIRDSNDDIVIRDEWQRTGVDEMDLAGPDQFDRTGSVVTGQFAGDQAGRDTPPPDWVDRLVRHSSIAKLEVDDDPGGGFHLYTDPPASFYTQSIAANITFDTGSDTRIAGVCARMDIGPDAVWTSVSGSGVQKKGYAFVVHATTGPNWTARIHRYTGTQWKVLAYRLLNKSGDSVTMAVSTAYDFQLDIANVNGGSAATGTVKLTCTIDGWTIDEWVLPEPGVSEDTDGGVLDARSDRVLSGTSIGFFASTASGTNNIFVNSTTRPAATDALDEREQPSIFIGGEKAGVTATALTVPHEWPLKTLYRDYGVKLRYESMHIHRHATALNQRRGWRIASDAAKLTEVTALRSFFEDQEGIEKPFPWTLPDGESVTVVFERDSLQIEKTGPNSYSFGFETWETLGPDYPTASFQDFNTGYVDAAEGGKETVQDPALGGDPLHPVWHFEDTFGSFTVTINLSGEAPLGGMFVRYEFGGTAVEGTHYAVMSGSQSPVYIAEGNTTATFDLVTQSSGKWYEEKLLTIKLAGTTDGPIDSVESELHVYIRPDDATSPPSFKWTAATYSGLTAGQLHTIQIEKVSGANTHEDDITAYFEVDSTSTAVEGTDFDFFPTPQAAYGTYTLSPTLASGGKRNVFIQSYGAASGKSLKLNLWTDKSDGTDMNRYSMTHLMDSETDDNTVKNFPREPSDNAHGPGGIIPPKPWDYFQDGTLEDPFGGPVHVFRHREVAKGAGYHRKSFDGQIFCAGMTDGIFEMTLYTRFSFYVRKPTGFELPPFVRLSIRDRGSSLAAPQKQTGAIHSQATANDTFDTLEDTTTNFTTEGVMAGWVVSNLTQGWKADVQSVATNVLTLTNQTGTGDWDINDWYTCYEAPGSYSGTADGKYQQNYAVHFQSSEDPISGATLYDGRYWRPYNTSSNWDNSGSDYGVETETIRDKDGNYNTYLRIWIIHHEDNADAIDNGQVRIWYPIYFGSNVDNIGGDNESNKGKALGVFWPMVETSTGVLSGAPGRYQPRDGYFWTPNGSGVWSGTESTTLSWS